jgi:hypothetical protein
VLGEPRPDSLPAIGPSIKVDADLMWKEFVDVHD